MKTIPRTNWAGSYRYGFGDCLFPETVEAVCEAVSRAEKIKVLGSRHSFNGIADGTLAIVLTGLPADPVVEAGGRQVSIGGQATYGELALFLGRHRLAVHNLASLPHISIAGAIATATHGSGDGNGNLATAVAGLEIVTADGGILRARRGDPDFAGMVVHLGALGVVTRVTLDVEPEFAVAQCVYEGLSWEAFLDNLDAVMAAGYSVSLFTQWGEAAGAAWVKRRSPTGDFPETLFGAARASVKRHPIIGVDPVNATDQLGLPGPWSDRLAHFRMGFMPSSGEEIQSEFHLPRRHGRAAIAALAAIRERFRDAVQASEFRTVAADELWMSPQYKRDTLSIHFTWVRDEEAVNAAVALVEEALARMTPCRIGGRCFWGGAWGRGMRGLGSLCG